MAAAKKASEVFNSNGDFKDVKYGWDCIKNHMCPLCRGDKREQEDCKNCGFNYRKKLAILELEN